MKTRRDFINQSLYAGLGLTLPSFLFFSCENTSKPSSIIATPVKSSVGGGVIKIVGYLIPVLIEQTIKKLFDSIGTNTGDPASIVDQSINIFSEGNYEVSTSYGNHYNRIIKPKIGTIKLNGIGLTGDDPSIKSRMNDFGARATTPIHSVRDLDNFSIDSWNNYCDLADLQADDIGRIYVTPRDERRDEWKETVYVTEELAYLLYNPLYYCHGLPIENPQRHYVNDKMKRDIYNKTKIKTNKSVYYTQRFFFQGTNCQPMQSTAPENIYYGVDNALSQYFELNTIKPCGDCKGDGIGRPKMERN